jgi:hypothetical protein
VQFPSSRRKTVFGGTLRQLPDGNARAPQKVRAACAEIFRIAREYSDEKAVRAPCLHDRCFYSALG